jgi:hypothetical protein
VQLRASLLKPFGARMLIDYWEPLMLRAPSFAPTDLPVSATLSSPHIASSHIAHPSDQTLFRAISTVTQSFITGPSCPAMLRMAALPSLCLKEKPLRAALVLQSPLASCACLNAVTVRLVCISNSAFTDMSKLLVRGARAVFWRQQ